MQDKEYYKELREIRKELARLKEEFEQSLRERTTWDIKSLEGSDLEEKYKERQN